MNAEFAWLGFGANQGDPVAQLSEARAALHRLPHCVVVSSSSLYSTAPVGDTEQARFINAVCCVSTLLSPPVLLGALHGIEQVAGRRRGARRFGPRPLDLDLLLYGNTGQLTINSANLVVPHPRLLTRRFVLEPLAEVNPELQLPGGVPVLRAVADCADQDCSILQSWP